MEEKTRPYVYVCQKCSLHGHFCFSNGKNSEEFSFYEKGYNILLEKRLKGKIDDCEFAVLLHQLQSSPILKYIELEKRLRSAFGDVEIVLHAIVHIMENESLIENFHGRILN